MNSVPLTGAKRQSNRNGAAKVVVGDGCYARVLAQVLGAAYLCVDMDPGIGKLQHKVQDDVAAVVVLPFGVSGPWFVRLHRRLWAGLNASKLRWLLIAETRDQAETVRQQDIFGRLDGTETVAKWGDCYPVVTRESALSAILGSIQDSRPIYRSTWTRHDTGMTIISEMRRRILTAASDSSEVSPQHLFKDLPPLAWDCFCSHEKANRIRKWLADDNVCHASWRQGSELLSHF
jgi:hypothetical protein